MRRSNTLIILGILAVILGALTLLGLVLEKRFESGDVYDRCSTLNTGPQGSKALFEAMGRLPAVECRRNYADLKKLEGSKGSTLVLLNVPIDQFDDGEALFGPGLERWVAGGGDLLITF